MYDDTPLWAKPPSPGPGPYNLDQLKGFARQAGFEGQDLNRIAAISYAESRGRPDAIGGVGELGVLQINPHAWGREAAQASTDPLTAFKFAHDVIMPRQGWRAWSTYNEGLYEPYMTKIADRAPQGGFMSAQAAEVPPPRFDDTPKWARGASAARQSVSPLPDDTPKWARPKGPQDPSIIARTKPQAGIEDPSIVARRRPFDPWRPQAPSTPEEKQAAAGEAALEGAAGKVAQWAQSKLPSWQELKSPDWLYNKLGDITNWTADKVESAAETTFTRLGVPSPQRAARDLTQYLFEFAPLQRGLGVSPRVAEPRLAEGPPKAGERIETPAVKPPEGPVTPTPNHPAAHAAGIEGQDGFITSGGQFVDRTEGARVAKEAQQAKPETGERLHSEDLKPGTSLAVPARPELPRQQVGPDPNGWVNTNAQANRDWSDRLGLTEDIERLFAEGKTARQVQDALGERLKSIDQSERPGFIVGVRATLGIPSRATKEGEIEFQDWLKNRQDRTSKPPSGTSLAVPASQRAVYTITEAPRTPDDEGFGGKTWYVNDEKGTRIADITGEIRGKDLHISFIGLPGEETALKGRNVEAGSLGPRKVRSIVDALRRKFPQIETVSGERFSGAHGISAGEKESPTVTQKIVAPPRSAGAMATPTHEILARNTRALERRLAAEEPTLKENLRGVANMIRSVTSPEKIIDVETGERSASQAAITIRKALGETTRMAEQMKASADKFYKTFNNMTPEQGLQVIRWIQKPETRALGAYRPTPEVEEFMKSLAEAMKFIEGELRKLPQTEKMQFRANFLSQMWRDPRSTMKWFQDRAPKTGSNYFTKKHVFDSYEDGIRNDRVPRTTNPLEIWMLYAENAFKKIASYRMVAEGREQGRIKYHAPGEQPNGWVELRLPDAHGKKAYAPPGYAEVFNNYLSIGPQGWFGKGIEGYIRAANYANAIKLALSFYHAGLMYNESMASGFANAIDSLVAGHPLRAMVKAGEAPVYPITSIIRGRQAIKAYLDENFGGPQTQRFINALVEANFRFKGKGNIADEYRASFLPTYWDSFRKGRLAIEARQSFANMKQHPIKGPAQAVVHTISRGIESFMAPIFQYAIPRLKVGAVMDMMHTYLLKNPTASDAELAAYGRYAANIVDNRFGEMNQDNIFWRRSQKMAGQALLVSPSFTFGTLRSGFGAAADTIKAIRAARDSKVLEGIKDPVTGVYHTAGDSWWTANMSYVPGLVLAMATTGAIVHYLMTGKPPETFRDLQYPQTGGTDPETGQPERAKTPSQLFSMESMVNPATTRSEFYNKLKDVPKWIIESLANEDWQHDIIYNPYHPVDQAFAEWMKYSWGMLGSPIYFEARRPEGSAIPESARFFGMTNAPKSVVDPEGSEAKKKWAFAEKEVTRQLHNSRERVSPKERYNRVLDEFYRYQGTQ